MKSLREKMVAGFTWNAVNVLVRQAITLAIHIFLARLLVPEDFGLIGMLSIFIELSRRIQGLGLGESLVRKPHVRQEEYNFVFYYGLLVGTLCYLTLFFLAPYISYFYAEPRLTLIIRVITLSLIITPLRGINYVQLVKEMNFKKIARIEITASTISGLLAVFFAFQGFGVWSLVIQTVSLHIISMVLYFSSKWWLPTPVLNRELSLALFSFGSKLMISNFIETGFKNIYNMIIGKKYTAHALGLYTQGMKLQRLPSNAVNAIIKNVSFPAFATISADKKRYKKGFRNSIKLLTFINFSLLAGLAAIADTLIPFLLSDKWIEAVPFFQILIVLGLLEPIRSLFINILKVEGDGERLIWYAIGTKGFYLAGILVGLQLDIYGLVMTQIAAAVLELAVYSGIGKRIHYSRIEFIKDIAPNVFLALTLGAVLVALNLQFPLKGVMQLICSGFAGLAWVVLIAFLTRNDSFMEIYGQLKLKLKKTER